MAEPRITSLRRRLLLGLVATTLAAFTVAVFLSYRDARHELEEVLDGYLAQSTALLLVQLAHEAHEIDTEHAPLLHRYSRNLAFQVWKDGRLHLHSANAPDSALSSVREGFSDSLVEGERWRVFSAWNDDHTLLVQVAERSRVRDELGRKVAWGLLRPLILALPVIVVMIWLVVGQGLRPLARLRQQVAARDPGNLAPIDTTAPAEVAPLIAALNGLFARVRESMENERRFTADAAHELRTPLAAIRTQAQVARAATGEAERRQALDQVIAGCDRATHLVEQLLLLARLEAGQGLMRRPCDLYALAAAAVAEVAPLALGKGVEPELEGKPASVAGDPALLQTLMRNLIDNAVRYSPRGGRVRVTVAAEPGAAVLAVSDQGPGIPAEERERVWERFHRVLGSGEPGSGLGLSIVRRIAELHGAKAALAPGEGDRGLTVTVRFPAA